MTLSPILQALGATIAAAFAWLWWTRRKATQRADAQERRAERAEADRAAANGRADVADATTATVSAQADRSAAGERDAKEIRDVPTTDDPARDRAALYERDRVLRTDPHRDR